MTMTCNRRRLVLIFVVLLSICNSPFVHAQKRKRKPKPKDSHGEKPKDFNSEEFQRQAKDFITTVFPVQKPRDILDGFGLALKSAAVGSTLGVTSFLALSGVGMLKVGGIKGTLVGVLGGGFTGFCLVTAGLLNGVYQIVLGAVNTPKAVQARVRGMRWDPSTHEWVLYFLDKEEEELSSFASFTAKQTQRKSSSLQSEKTDSDPDDYYVMLGVPRDISTKEIKKAYYRKAKDVHPDKHPDDEEAANKFIKLQTAYQTLSDDKKRSEYDTWGRQNEGGKRHEINFDPYVFFAVLFDSQLVEPYIGDLSVAWAIDQLLQLTKLEPDLELIMKVFVSAAYRDRKRHLGIALNLVELVEEYVNGSQTVEEFRSTCRAEAELIGEGAFSDRFLTLIGAALKREANEFLGYSSVLVFPVGVFYSITKRITGISSMVQCIHKVAKLFLGMYVHVRDAPTMTKENFQENFPISDFLPGILEVAWSYNQRDISSAVHGASWRLFEDGNSSLGVRKKRAEAVKIMGDEFLKITRGPGKNETCDDGQAEAADIQRRLEMATKMAQMKVSCLFII
jgi:DnaJ-domain-containing protein 1